MKLKKVGTKKPKLRKVSRKLPFSINLSCDFVGNFPHNPIMRDYYIITERWQLKEFQKEIMKQSAFAFDTETNTLEVLSDNKDFKCVGLSFSWGESNNYYIPIGHVREEDIDNQLYPDIVIDVLQQVFSQTNVLIFGWNIKYDLHVLLRLGIKVATKNVFDGMLASWLCNENTPNGLKENTTEKLGIAQTHFKEATATVPNNVKKEFGYSANSKVTFDLVLIKDGAKYACDDAFYTWCNCIGFQKELVTEKMDKIYYKMYIPFLFVLLEMEEKGVTVDVARLEQMGKDMENDLEELRYKIYDLAGVEFNINSNQQKSELLFGFEKERKPLVLSKLPKYIQKAFNEEDKDLLEEKGYEILGNKLYKKNDSKVLKYSFHFKPTSTTASGNPSTDSDSIWRLSRKNYSNNKRKQQGVKMCEYMLDYAKLGKLKTAFVDGILDKLYADGKAHPSFNQIGTSSGRLSCIAKDSLIKCVGEDKCIQDVKVGDLVYCYDERGNLQIKKVLNVFNRGVKKCVSLNWSSQGTHEFGNLICTPDHKILNHNLEWVRADSLSPKSKVVHLRRNLGERPRLYGYNKFYKQEQVVIKNLYFNCYDENICIHHKDGIKYNNLIENLTLMTRKEHTRLHSKELVKQGRIKTDQLRVPHKVLSGKEHPMYKEVSKEQLEKLVREYKGRIRNIPMDFNTFKKKCKEVGFDYKKVASEYQIKYKEVSDEDFINAFYECRGVPSAIQKKLGIGRVKVKKTIEKLDLCFNHKIISVTDVGERQVYDLEVEDCHNFIANEICVHNCSNPNLQQLPKAEEDDKYQIRSVFIGSLYGISKDGSMTEIKGESYNVGDTFKQDGKEYEVKRKQIIAIDYHNLEMVCLTHFSGDKNLSTMFANDDDAHGSTAVNMFNLDCTPVECKKKYPHLRQASKTINFLNQ